MGKLSSGWLGGEDDDDDDDPDEKKRRLKKELEQIRKNALGRKRDLRSKNSVIQKSSFIKTLNQFASQRRKLEDATQITHNLISKPKIIKQEVIQPRDLRGFFRAGVKGRELTRPDPALEKLRNAVLQSDALQLLQSATFCHRFEEKQQPSKNTKSPIEDHHAELKMEVAKILNNFNSSESSSLDLDNLGTIEFSSSPVIGRCVGAKKKINQSKIAVNAEINNLYSQENGFSLVNNTSKEQRYRRRLFDEATAVVNSKLNEVTNNPLCNNGASRNSTPKNVMFYSEVVSKQPANKINKINKTIKYSDPDIIQYYVEICKYMGLKDLKNMFRNNYKDPEESAKEALKSTYKKQLKDFLQRQNCQRKSTDQTTPSSKSEIMMEPDSDIVRIVKKNIAFQKQKESTATASNSTDSTKNFVHKVNARSSANAVDDKTVKRKQAPSSKGSEADVPSSTQAIADPKSVRADSKMNNIHPDRQELVARFLEDQKSFASEASQEIHESHVHKENLYINHSSKGTYLIKKNTKFVPLILRKNRSLADCVAKEKATIMTIENCPSQKNNKSSVLELNNLDNVESERTPNTITEPLLEAPKCKYVHHNAKYNQPCRINIPIIQDNRCQRNPVAERHSQRFPSPNSVQTSFTLSQTYNLSPIKQLPSYQSDISHDFHLCQLSQESKTSDNGNNGMTRMLSFGDIQDRTNRLTLCSQSQNCSQENVEHACASQHSHTSYHYQPCESTSSCNLLKNQPHMSFAEPSYDKSNCECSSSLRCMDRAAYISQNEYQVIPQSDLNESSNCSCCHQSSKETMMNRVPGRQPVKYHAAEGSRRQPIYNPNDSCSFLHKQPCCSTSRADSSDFEYLDMLKINYGGGGDRPQTFAPPNANQRCIVQRQIPPSPVCHQITYRHGHHSSNNEGYKMSDAYVHHMNRQMHSKKQ